MITHYQQGIVNKIIRGQVPTDQELRELKIFKRKGWRKRFLRTMKMAKGLPQYREPKRQRIVDPSDKAARTMGLPMSGRSTLKQQAFLARHGHDRAKTMRWTKYHASQEIGKIIERLNTETHASLDRQMDQAIALA